MPLLKPSNHRSWVGVNDEDLAFIGLIKTERVERLHR
jgi:hypothetical protein